MSTVQIYNVKFQTMRKRLYGKKRKYTNIKVGDIILCKPLHRLQNSNHTDAYCIVGKGNLYRLSFDSYKRERNCVKSINCTLPEEFSFPTWKHSDFAGFEAEFPTVGLHLQIDVLKLLKPYLKIKDEPQSSSKNTVEEYKDPSSYITSYDSKYAELIYTKRDDSYTDINDYIVLDWVMLRTYSIMRYNEDFIKYHLAGSKTTLYKVDNELHLCSNVYYKGADYTGLNVYTECWKQYNKMTNEKDLKKVILNYFDCYNEAYYEGECFFMINGKSY